jgi:hypothetical protein
MHLLRAAAVALLYCVVSRYGARSYNFFSEGKFWHFSVEDIYLFTRLDAAKSVLRKGLGKSAALGTVCQGGRDGRITLGYRALPPFTHSLFPLRAAYGPSRCSGFMPHFVRPGLSRFLKFSFGSSLIRLPLSPRTPFEKVRNFLFLEGLFSF